MKSEIDLTPQEIRTIVLLLAKATLALQADHKTIHRKLIALKAEAEIEALVE